ncbi:MAG: alcohol dehydrogenase catalytic domain-containing protein [Propionibacteriaceae bacterium]|nr:alcohol dehydrogenase catalytic domain-containing protein [Propionibacteriaceae bacterium]
MKAAVVEAPGVLRVRDDVGWDPAPGPYEAVCRVIVGATCTGTDLHVIDGTFPSAVGYPAILGHESVGRVIAVGSEVRNLAPGDVVTRVGARPTPDLGVAWGGFSEFAVAVDHRAMAADGLPTELWSFHRPQLVVPPDIAPETAAMFITWRETLSYLHRLEAPQGARVLISGSGGNALAFAVHARHLGASSVTVVGSGRWREVFESAGAETFIDYRGASRAEQLRSAGPFDCFIDAVGSSDVRADAVACLEQGAVVGVYGLNEPPPATPAGGSLRWYDGGYEEHETHDEVVRLVRGGILKADRWLPPGMVPLDEIGSAYDALRQRRALKLLISM